MKCHCCSRSTHLPFVCKYCSFSFCVSCIQYEIHQCTHTKDMQHQQKNDLKTRLENHACVATKLKKI